MDDQERDILRALADNGVEHHPESLSKYHSQGLMSSVYSISTPKGELIIHVSKLTESLEYFQRGEKLKSISEFLRAIPGVPAAEVLFTVKWPQQYLVVQQKLRGQSAGTIEFKDGTIVLTWKDSSGGIESQIEDIMAKVHQAPLKGYGQLVVSDDGLRGRYNSWEEFLRTDMPFWLEGIARADSILKAPKDTLIEDSIDLFGRVIEHIAPLERASLVSCDAMNPSNILVENGKVTGVIDWEWALAADPAWEFCYLNQFPLTHYFNYFPHLSDASAQKRFLSRARIYEHLLYTMWCFAVSGEPESHFYKVTRARLKNKLAGANKLLKDFA